MPLSIPFSFGQYMLFKGKNLYNLTDGRIISSFQGLLSDFEKLTYGSYLCELIDISLPEGEVNPPLFKELITALYLLNTDALENELLIRAFELKLLKYTGYGLNLSSCASCKKAISTSQYINLNLYSGVCESCPKLNSVEVSKGAYNTLRFLSGTSLDKIYRLNVSDGVKEEIKKVLNYIIASSYGRKPKSLELLNNL